MNTKKRVILRRNSWGCEIQVFFIVWWDTDIPPFAKHFDAALFMSYLNDPLKHISIIKTINRWIYDLKQYVLMFWQKWGI